MRRIAATVRSKRDRWIKNALIAQNHNSHSSKPFIDSLIRPINTVVHSILALKTRRERV